MSEEKGHSSENGAMNGSENLSEESQAANSVENELKAQIEKSRNDFLYLKAEFDNYRKHAVKERSELMKYGSERIFVDLLTVLDNFERALDSKVTAENIQTYVKGVEMTATEFKSLLQKFGITEVAAQGMVFDPNMHEALGAEETTVVPDGHVSKVFKKPYKLHDKLIRPGQVVVAKTPTAK